MSDIRTMSDEECRKALLYYEQFCYMMADELNVNGIRLSPFKGEDRDSGEMSEFVAEYDFNTLTREGGKLRLLKNGEEIDKPRALLAIAMGSFDGGDV